MRALLLLALVSGCAGRVSNATAEQEHATDLAIAEWELHFGFAPACDIDRETLRWELLPDVASVNRRCGGGDHVDACHQRNYDGESTILVHAERGRYFTEAYAHELTHWLQRCSDRAPSGDPEHAEPRVWPGFERALRVRLRAELAP
jgi:hypothetical protein